MELIVNKLGSDKIGNGTFFNPYLSITAALNSIPTNNTNNYLIIIGPGTYNESVSIKSSVVIKGASNINTVINGSININNKSWKVQNTPKVSGIQDLTITGPTIFIDFGSNIDSTFYFNNTNINNTTLSLITIGPSNTVQINNSSVQNPITSTNINLQLINSVVNGLRILSSIETKITATGGCNNGNLYIASLSVEDSFTLNVFLSAFPTLGELNVDKGVIITATGESIPLVFNISPLSTLIKDTSTESQVYNPAMPLMWEVIPETAGQALDELAAVIPSATDCGIEVVGMQNLEKDGVGKGWYTLIGDVVSCSFVVILKSGVDVKDSASFEFSVPVEKGGGFGEKRELVGTVNCNAEDYEGNNRLVVMGSRCCAVVGSGSDEGGRGKVLLYPCPADSNIVVAVSFVYSRV